MLHVIVFFSGKFHNIKTTLLFLLAVILLASCSSTKNLPAAETLYVGSNIKIDVTDKADKKEVKDLKTELKSLLRPKPNTSILGIRYKLFFYNLVKEPKKQKGLFYTIKYKLGEPPVLGSQVNIEKNALLLQNRLENRGYFGSAVAGDTLVKNKKLTVLYNVKLSPRYYINSVTYPTDSSDLSKDINNITKGSLLKVGKPYDLDVIKEERARIDTRLKNRGFFYFSDNYIIVNVDSVNNNNKGEHKVDLRVAIKNETPYAAQKIYRLNDIVVYADYTLDSDTGLAVNGVDYEGYKIVDPLKKYKPVIFSRSLIFKPGDIYKRDDHNLSLNRMVDLGIFKFVKVRFESVDTMKGNFLNAFYYLSPTKKKSVRAEVSALTKSNNSNGTELTLSWRNRNLLRGAELLTVSAFGGIESQVSGQGNISTTRYGGELNLIVPRIVGPLKFKTNSGYVPKTKATLGYELFNRNTQYKLNSFKASFGYVFKDDITKEHQFNPLSINYVKPGKITPEFQKQLDTNITLRRTIEKQFIIGSTYNYNVNTQARNNRKRNNFYFNGNIDVSGNLLGVVTGANAKAGKQKTLFGTPFSQYSRVEIEGRHYFRLGKTLDNIVATRLLLGSGFAYGNSTNMPFIKQFFIGGTNSIRAFRARSLGPGKYYAGNLQRGGFLPDQPGDIKIEANTELRAKLFSIVQGAIFFDAGNIWLTKEDSTRPGGKFSKDFIKEMAVGTGLGLRFDIKFLVLRVDVAFPLRKPYLPGGPRWVIDEIRFDSKDWRKNNLVYNLAIGYPF